MLENIQSKTKTPTAISLKDDERVFGADAMAKKPRFPKNVLTFLHEYLAKPYSSPEIKEFIDNYFISYDMEEDENRNTIQIKIQYNKEEYKFSVEEIFGMLFRYIKYLADKFTGTDINDCVVTVPNFFGYKERQAIIQATELSKLNLLGITTENTGAAIQFAQNKNFNTTEYYIFYNMGASYTQATLVSFLSNMQNKNNKTVEVSKTISILSESWDRIGGNVFNYNLVKNLMKTFDQMPERKDKGSVINDARVAERILPGAIKYKEILSANKDVPVTILGVDSGMNLKTKLTRDQFEEINAESLSRAYIPIEKLLNKTGITLDQVQQIELLGGSVRVPKVREVLRANLGIDYEGKLGTHMNGDDSMAFGAAYICANFSENFKGGKIELYHGPNYDIQIKLRNLPGDLCEGDNINQTLAVNCTNILNKTTTLYKARRGLDLTRKVTFKYDNDFEILISQIFDAESQPTTSETLLQTYSIKGVKEFISSNSDISTPPKIVLKFKQDSRGLLSLTAEIVHETVLYLHLQTGPSGGTEVLFLTNYTEPISQEELKKMEEEMKTKNMTDAEKRIFSMRKDVGKKKVQENKKDLTYEIIYSNPRPLNKEEMNISKEKLDKLDHYDENRIKTMEKRNALETLIINKRDWLEDAEPKIYGKESEIQVATDGLGQISDWFDVSGYDAQFDILNTKFIELNDLFKTFELRKRKHFDREKSTEFFHSTLKKALDDAKSTISSKPWLETHYNNTFLKEVNTVETWFNLTKDKQDSLALHEVSLILM